MREPLYKRIRDPNVRAWFHHISLNSRDYQFGWLQITTGRTRAGKTLANILHAVLLARKPFVIEQIGWKPDSYLSALEAAGRCEPVVWTEMGRGMSARRWFEEKNKIITEIMQTMQIDRPMVFMDVNDMSFVDVQVRKMARIHAIITRRDRHAVTMRLYNINVNPFDGQVRNYHPLLRTKDGFVRLNSIRLEDTLSKVAPDIYESFKRYERKVKDDFKAHHTEEMKAISFRTSDMGLSDVIQAVKKDLPRFTGRMGRINEELIETQLHVPQKLSRATAHIVNKEIQTEKLNTK